MHANFNFRKLLAFIRVSTTFAIYLILDIIFSKYFEHNNY